MRVLLIFIVVFLGSCSQSSDPLKDAPPNITKAVPLDDKPIDERKPTPRDWMVIDMSPLSLSIEEGVEGRAIFTGRLLDGTTEYSLSIKDLPAGASFDAKSGEFIWTPGFSVVTGDYFQKKIPIVVVMQSDGNKREEVFYVYVYRNVSSRPEIFAPVIGKEPVYENKTMDIEVRIKDETSVDSGFNVSRPPRLIIEPVLKGVRDASPYVKLKYPGYFGHNPVQDELDPTIWVFTLKVDFNNRNVIKRDTVMKFDLIAFSHFGVPSKAQTIEFSVKNYIRFPAITWGEGRGEKIIFYKGHKNYYSFRAFDPLVEGRVSAADFVNSCSQLGGDAKCMCSEVGRRYSSAGVGSLCKLSWTPGVEISVSERKFSFQVTNTNFDDSLDVRSLDFRRKIYLREASPTQGPNKIVKERER